jgi:acyl-CoA reductase-like NAD-dependent aldehyde dehydrogenase
LHIIGRVGVSNAADVDLAVSVAKDALPAWSTLTMKARAAIVSECCQDEMRPFQFSSSLVCWTLRCR